MVRIFLCIVCIFVVVNDVVTLPTTSPFSELDCASTATPDENWIFETWPASQPCYSCTTSSVPGMNVRSDHARMCVSASGEPDYTSIYVDMQPLQNKTGCFASVSGSCTMDLMRVSSITFDVDVKNCEDLWAAPLWLAPDPWVGPADISGEIDFCEFCPTGTIATNFGAGGARNEKEQSWGSVILSEPKHFVMTLLKASSGGDLGTKVCKLDATSCFNGGYYADFLNTVNSARGKDATTPYAFISDVWNGLGGDGGWGACKAQNNQNTNCQYAVRNIRVYTHDGSSMFSSGKCTALNGEKSNAPSPIPLPTPVPAPYQGACCPANASQPLFCCWTEEGCCSTSSLDCCKSSAVTSV